MKCIRGVFVLFHGFRGRSYEFVPLEGSRELKFTQRHLRDTWTSSLANAGCFLMDSQTDYGFESFFAFITYPCSFSVLH